MLGSTIVWEIAMTNHEGGCLCGELRYETLSDPVNVTVCHCRFCQRATGTAYMVESVFRQEDLRIMRGVPAVYPLPSGGSGKTIYVHFCSLCGTKLFLTFERFTNEYGVFSGTFDDPNWFAMRPDNTKHIFTGVARKDTILPAGISTFDEHAILNDGTPLKPVLFEQPQVVGN
jgi:hypothetical protein